VLHLKNAEKPGTVAPPAASALVATKCVCRSTDAHSRGACNLSPSQLPPPSTPPPLPRLSPSIGASSPTLSTTIDASSLLLCCAAWWADLCGAVGSRILRRRRISHLPRRWVELLASRGLRNGLGRPLGMLTCDGLSEERWQRGSRTNTPGT
jgi:hypothetical protein